MTPESNSSALSHDAANDAGNNAAATIDTRAAGNIAKAATATAAVGINSADATKDSADPTTAKTVALDPTVKEQEAPAAPAATDDKAKKKSYIPVLSELGGAWDSITNGMRNITPAALINNSSRLIFGIKVVADGFGIASGLGLFYKGVSEEAKKKARSPWRIGANVVSLGMLIPGMIYKEKPDTKAQEEEYKKMGIGEYLITKAKHSLDPKNHPVEFAALGTMINGLMTMKSGMQQAGSIKNSKEFKQGAYTLTAGAILGLWPDRERAWQASTAVFFARIPTKYDQARSAYTKGIPEKGVPKGDIFQLGNFWLQQAANFLSVFYAGVKKLPDGSIVKLGKKGQSEEKLEAAQETLKSKKVRKAEAVAEVTAEVISDPEPTSEKVRETLKAAAQDVGERHVLQALINNSGAEQTTTESAGKIEDAIAQESTTRQLASDALKSNALDSRLAKQGLSHAERAEQSQSEQTAALGA